MIENNECFENKMAGIGSREDAAPVIRGNRCHGNEMAGIGSRLGARPVITDNDCYRNRMAGIGSREGAAPIIHANRCYENAMAGIGSRRGARPVISDNESRQNRMAGIGVRDEATVAVIVGNRCIENRLVAIGLPDGATGFIHGNELKRTGGGAPPLVAVKGGSTALVSHNSISGGGVAGVLAEGEVRVIGNRFQGKGPGQGSAVWVWKDSTVTVSDNRFRGYRNAINAGGSRVTATDNVVREFEGPSIIVRKPSAPAHVCNNTALSKNPGDRAVDLDGGDQRADRNVLRNPDEAGEAAYPSPPVWPLASKDVIGDACHPLAGTGRVVTVEEGPWKLVATYGESTSHALFNTADDPEGKTDLSPRLEHITFRLRGMLERREGLEYQAEMGSREPGK